MATSRVWGGFRSLIGRALMMFGLGLFFQVFGQIAYSYYIYVLHIDVPYPSLGDIGYFGSIPFYIYGVYLLTKVSGVKVGMRTLVNKAQAILIPVGMLIFSYVIFLRNYTFDFSNPLAVFLDFGYPLGQAIYVSIAILTYTLSRNILGGIMRKKILFLVFALVAQYLADYVFLFQVSTDTWRLGGFNEWMYLASYFLMTFAILQFKTAYDELKHIKK